jgi:segregation and condensation protein B
MVTRPEIGDEIGRFIAAGSGRGALSKPALETLAIVAYRQPVTQSEIEAVRGVSVDGVLKTLSDRDLIVVTGRKNVPGRPILYGTTTVFLHYFGLDSLAELPPLELDDFDESAGDAAARHMVEMAVGID